MPPLPALHIKALDDLATQLRFAPPGAARRQLERAEDLFAVLQPEQAYPEDWIVFAITGYRPDIPEPTLVMGAPLLGELGILAERLSAAAELSDADLPGLHDSPPKWLPAEALCERWRISRKTLDRYRRRGLPARRVRAASGRDKLYFSLRFIIDFETRHADVIREASSFSRLEPALEAKLVRLAAKYRARLGWSLNKTAERLAERTGRGHETIRQLLKRHDKPARAKNVEPAKPPVFDERGPLSDHERRVVDRAHARGVPVERLATRFSRTRASIYRVLARERVDFLRSLPLPTPDAPDLAAVPNLPKLLRGESASSNLGARAPATLLELLRDADANQITDPRAERERAIAYWALRAEAARLISLLPRHNVAAGACDEIETALRWASRLKAELVRSQQSHIFRTLRATLGTTGEITSLPRAAAASLLSTAIDAIIESTDRFDPTKGGRLAAPVGLALHHAVTRWAKSQPPRAGAVPGRASTVLDPASLALPDWTTRLDPWQTRLEPDARIRSVLPILEQDVVGFLSARFGWTPLGRAPQTLAAMAPTFKLTLHHMTAFEREAIATALLAARDSTPARPEAPRV